MQDPHKTLNLMEKILRQSTEWDRHGSLAARTLCNIVIKDLYSYVEAHNLEGWAQIQGQLGALSSDVSALYEFNADRRDIKEAHQVGALDKLSKVRSRIP